MKKILKRILGIVIVLFILFSIAFILTLPFSILLNALKCFLGNNYLGISSFWKINFFFSSFTLLILCFLLDKYEANIDKFLRNRCPDNKTNKEEHKTMKTPKIDDTDLNTYSNKDVWVTYSNKDVWVTRKNFNSEKQFCYDSSNPCPYCNTKFKHNALHCAVYFNDIERVKEVIQLIYKAYKVDDCLTNLQVNTYLAYKVDDCLTNLQVNTYLFAFDRMIFKEKDFRHINVIDLAILIGNVDSIKLLLQAAGTYYKVYDNNWINNRICMYPEDESIKQMISIYQYKKHQTGKDILNKDDKNPLSKGYSKTPN